MCGSRVWTRRTESRLGLRSTTPGTGISGRRAQSGACSGSGPIAITRAGMPCSTGNRRTSRSGSGSDADGRCLRSFSPVRRWPQSRTRRRGAGSGPRPARTAGPTASTGRRIRRCASRCPAWISAVGHHRRSCTRRSTDTGTDPSARSAGARIRAAATASCTARLIPTPPTGRHRVRGVTDQQQPVGVPAAQPVQAHVEQLDVVERGERVDPVRDPRLQRRRAAAGTRRSPPRAAGVAALADEVGALPVVCRGRSSP